MNTDELEITILDDGTIRTTTPKVSAANHSNAAAFLKLLATYTGGTTEIKKREGHTHTHDHGKEHQHS